MKLITDATGGIGVRMGASCHRDCVPPEQARRFGYQRSTRCSWPGGGSYGSGQKSVTLVIRSALYFKMHRVGVKSRPSSKMLRRKQAAGIISEDHVPVPCE